MPTEKAIERISDTHSQHERIADAGESKCWRDANGPVRRDGIAKDRTEILLLALPVETDRCVFVDGR